MEPVTLTNEQLGEKVEKLTGQANSLIETLGDAPKPDDIKAVKDEMESLQASIQPLLEEQSRRLTDESMKALAGEVTNLNDAVKELREGQRLPDFLDLGLTGKSLGDVAERYADGERSMFRDIALASRGGKAGTEAAERLESHLGGKAMTEGDETAGGYLVKPQYLGEIDPVSRIDPLLARIPQVRVNTDKVEFVSITEGLAAGWTAELALKPLGADIGFATLEASVFTAAGLAVASNQLLEDSSIDRLIARELEKRVQAVIGAGIVAGTGDGQPRGIINTPGVPHDEYDDASPTVLELLKRIAVNIAGVIEDHSENIEIILRPSTWTAIILDSDAEGKFTLGGPNGQARTASDPFPGRTLFGYPVTLSRSIPADFNDDGSKGGDQTRVIVGDLSETLLLVRSELAVDKSEHVYFTSNQTVFRGERRVGFTAARYPRAFRTIGGTGLETAASGNGIF